MRGLAAIRALINVARFVAREGHAPLGQLAHRIGRAFAQAGDGVLIAQPVGSAHGVVHVPAPVILAARAERGVDAALRRHRMAAARIDLADRRHAQAAFGRSNGRAQAGAAGADDHHVIFMLRKFVSVHI